MCCYVHANASFVKVINNDSSSYKVSFLVRPEGFTGPSSSKKFAIKAGGKSTGYYDIPKTTKYLPLSVARLLDQTGRINASSNLRMSLSLKELPSKAEVWSLCDINITAKHRQEVKCVANNLSIIRSEPMVFWGLSFPELILVWIANKQMIVKVYFVNSVGELEEQL